MAARALRFDFIFSPLPVEALVVREGLSLVWKGVSMQLLLRVILSRT